MKKMLLTVILLLLCGSLLPSYAQRVVSNSRIASRSTIVGTNRPYVKPMRHHHHRGYNGRCNQYGNGVQVYKTHHPKYVTQYYDGFENNNFSKRSYYIPTYCQPGAAIHNSDYNPFCNHYKPYGSGVYVSF